MAVFVADIIETTGKLKAALAETKLDLMEILKILILLDGLDAEHAFANNFYLMITSRSLQPLQAVLRRLKLLAMPMMKMMLQRQPPKQ